MLRAEGIIYMVLEYGDIDLARLLEKRARARAQLQQGSDLDGNFIRLYWQQMLQVHSTLGFELWGSAFGHEGPHLPL